MRTNTLVWVCAAFILGCGSDDAEPASEPAPTSTSAKASAKTVTDSPEKVARAVVSEIAAGNFDAAVARFDATMKSKLPADKLAAVWKRMVEQLGSYGGIAKTRVEQRDDLTVVYVTMDLAKMDFDAKVAVTPSGEVTGLFFVPAKPDASELDAPDYANGDAFTEIEIAFGKTPWELPGTLTLPEGDGPFPAVVLVHGSGPHDRDETIGANKPFRDLAWGLASQGIAVLRYEKRTKIHGARLAKVGSFTVEDETVIDAVAAARFARGRKEIADDNVYVVGHSLGGTVAPRIAHAAKDAVAGIIILAGSTRPLTELLVDQTTYMANLDGKLSDEEKKSIAAVKKKVAEVEAVIASKKPGGSKLLLNLPVSYWRDLAAYDEVAAAKKLDIPIFILQGGRDYQVTEKDFKGWKAGLKGRKNVSFKLYPALNHLFIVGEGKSEPAEYTEAGHVAEQVVTDIAAWIKN